MKRYLGIIGFLLCLLLLPIPTASAESVTDTGLKLSVSSNGTAYSRLTDNNHNTTQEINKGELRIEGSSKIKGLYIIFDSPCSDWGIVTSSGKQPLGLNNFLHAFADISKYTHAESITLYFENSTKICDIYAFENNDIPDWVQIWQPPSKEADILLLSSHSDDEQLFFAGLLPYYAGERRLTVQVAYFTNHDDNPRRRHEQLNGLWTVGVKNYPYIGKLPDLYSESKESALRNWAGHGFSEQDIVGSQVMLLRRFKPQVVIGHDIEGEYGHGAHILNTDTLLQALKVSDDPSQFPESAEQFGTHIPKKVYLHLYKENQITMDWDKPLTAFGGRTAYEVSCEGFDCHKSQHWTWFKKWLLGTDSKPITAASQIKTYSPCSYGLYYTQVGADTVGGDFFENLTAYAEIKRLKAEAEAKAELEARQKEQEAKKTSAQKLKKQKRQQTALIAVAIILAISLVVTLIKTRSRKRK